jgi:parvulin-like peptidyl-prolyl isomerase
MRKLLPFVLFVVAVTGCRKREAEIQQASGSGSGSDQKVVTTPGPGSAGGGSATAPAAPPKDIDSKDIMARSETFPMVNVKHVLIGWKELEAVLGDRIHARAKARGNADAATLAQDVLAKLQKDPKQIDALIAQYGEDPGMRSGSSYRVRAETEFVPEFKKLALRLKENEAGIARSDFGYHVIERVPFDPLESSDVFTRTAETTPVHVQQILIGWKDVPAAGKIPLDPRSEKRTKEDADKLVKEVFEKVKANGDMAKLMAEYSEDQGTKESGMSIEMSPAARYLEEFKELALRLKVGEAGVVRTALGWHIMKRLAKATPDPLESTAILDRTTTAPKVKVKHVLLGWKGANTGDDRAKNRDKVALEKLIKETVAKLQKGDKIEPLMAELSEDPGSAKAGTPYDVQPDTPFVEPFKKLSLRLKPNEVGVVRSDFGYHIIQRVE